MQIWKDIITPEIDYSGLYSISNTGLVRNKFTGTIYTNAVNSRGYITHSLVKNDISKRYQTHRLVAFAFIENPDNLPQVNHINGNKTDNTVGNLEWCTCSYNIKDSYKRDHKGHDKTRFALGKNPRAKKVINNITGEEFSSAAEIAEKIGLTKRAFCKRLAGELINNTGYSYAV